MDSTWIVESPRDRAIEHLPDWPPEPESTMNKYTPQCEVKTQLLASTGRCSSNRIPPELELQEDLYPDRNRSNPAGKCDCFSSKSPPKLQKPAPEREPMTPKLPNKDGENDAGSSELKDALTPRRRTRRLPARYADGSTDIQCTFKTRKPRSRAASRRGGVLRAVSRASGSYSLSRNSDGMTPLVNTCSLMPSLYSPTSKNVTTPEREDWDMLNGGSDTATVASDSGFSNLESVDSLDQASLSPSPVFRRGRGAIRGRGRCRGFTTSRGKHAVSHGDVVTVLNEEPNDFIPIKSEESAERKCGYFTLVSSMVEKAAVTSRSSSLSLNLSNDKVELGDHQYSQSAVRQFAAEGCKPLQSCGAGNTFLNGKGDDSSLKSKDSEGSQIQNVKTEGLMEPITVEYAQWRHDTSCVPEPVAKRKKVKLIRELQNLIDESIKVSKTLGTSVNRPLRRFAVRQKPRRKQREFEYLMDFLQSSGGPQSLTRALGKVRGSFTNSTFSTGAYIASPSKIRASLMPSGVRRLLSSSVSKAPLAPQFSASTLASEAKPSPVECGLVINPCQTSMHCGSQDITDCNSKVCKESGEKENTSLGREILSVQTADLPESKPGEDVVMDKIRPREEGRIKPSVTSLVAQKKKAIRMKLALEKKKNYKLATKRNSDIDVANDLSLPDETSLSHMKPKELPSFTPPATEIHLVEVVQPLKTDLSPHENFVSDGNLRESQHDTVQLQLVPVTSVAGRDASKLKQGQDEDGARSNSATIVPNWNCPNKSSQFDCEVSGVTKTLKRPRGRPRIHWFSSPPKEPKLSRHGKKLGRPRTRHVPQLAFIHGMNKGVASSLGLHATAPSLPTERVPGGSFGVVGIPAYAASVASPPLVIPSAAVPSLGVLTNPEGRLIREKRVSVRQAESVFRYREIAVKKHEKFIQVLLLSTCKQKNALNMQALYELESVFQSASKDSSCHVMLLSGVGNVFCSGLELRGLLNDPELSHCQLTDALRSFLRALVSFPKPVVASVNGVALGLGVTLLPLCDIVYASDKALFRTLYGRLGHAPEGGASYTLPTLLGAAKASEFLLGGRQLTAREAYEHGLVSQVLWPETFMEEVIPRVQNLATQSMQALETTKALIRCHQRARVDAAIEMECCLLTAQWQTLECQNAIRDFLHDVGDDLSV